jgi:acyl dehydratase
MPGKYFEDLEPGFKLRHATGRTLTETDNVLFCSLTMNPQPLHLNEDFAKKTAFGRRIMNGILTMGLVVGLTVTELTEGTIVANLSYDKVQHPAPVYAGDTIYVESEVLERRESATKRDRGIVRLLHRARNQEGTLVCVIERTVLFLRRPPEPAPKAAT